MSSTLLAALLAVAPLRVAIDPGHGAPQNEGNHGCECQLEQDHTLAVAQYVAFVLSDLGPFQVTLLRQPGEAPTYQERLRRAAAFRAEVLVSFHSDARGEASAWRQTDTGEPCFRSDAAPGFAVLWSQEGAAPLREARARLGRTVGRALRAAGFSAYSGEDYGSLYVQDDVEPSGWIDVRPKGKRVFMLYASPIPTVIIETHHALDPAEVKRWSQTQTLDDFTQALAGALLETRGRLWAR